VLEIFSDAVLWRLCLACIGERFFTHSGPSRQGFVSRAIWLAAIRRKPVGFRWSQLVFASFKARRWCVAQTWPTRQGARGHQARTWHGGPCFGGWLDLRGDPKLR
jgi:hypothetical protein